MSKKNHGKYFAAVTNKKKKKSVAIVSAVLAVANQSKKMNNLLPLSPQDPKHIKVMLQIIRINDFFKV